MENISTSTRLLEELRDKLDQFRKAPTAFKVFTGFDGFVDKIQKAIRKKAGGKNIYFNTIKEFSTHLQGLSGKSGQIEIETKEIKMGGNAPILANTLGAMGIKSYCIGSMGLVHGINKEFVGMHPNCKVISISDPGDSRAIEFEDGKIILSELGVFDNYNWNYIKSKVGLEVIMNMINECQIVAFVDWVNLPHATDIWEGFLEDIVKHSHRNDFFFLFDLCDPSKKSPQQIDEMLDLISSFSAYGKVTLGLNENESNRVWQTLHGQSPDTNTSSINIPPLTEIGLAIYNSLKVDTLLIHPIDRTLIINKHKIYEMKGRVVTEPKILTGGGDNLNAGYCLGLHTGLDMPQCMLLGMATSGAYIEYGHRPTLDDLLQYVTHWIAELKVEKSSRIFNKEHSKLM